MELDCTRRGSTQLSVLWIAAIIIIGFNLRPAITSVGPLLGLIRDDLDLANWSAGLITSLPLIAFAATSPLASKLGWKFGNISAVTVGLLSLLGGIFVRSIPTIPSLFIGTAFVGVGIAVLNVLLPAVIKEKFPYRVGRMTSLYTTSMAVLAATASGVSIPLANLTGFGWKLSLGTWSIFAVIGLIIWLIIIKCENKPVMNLKEVHGTSSRQSMLHSFLAWQVTLFMGLQAFIFYTLISWLPEMLMDYGFTVSTAGWLLSYMQFASLPSTFLVPVLAERFDNQKGIVLAIGGLFILALTGLLFGGPLPLIVIWITILSIPSGATISLSLTLLSIRVRTAKQAGQLSGMAQSVGYTFAAVGPPLIGLFYDLSTSWGIPILTLIIACIIMTVVGIGAGRRRYVLEY